MSDLIKEKAESHKVQHLFSGKNHYFLVESKSGEKYNVSIQISCDCRYMSVQGVANAKMCSHVLAALKHIVNNSEINQNGNHK